MAAKQVKRLYKYSYPIISEDEISYHYNLTKSKRPIPISKIHPTLFPDIKNILREKGLVDIKSIPLPIYKGWIKKIKTMGLDYPIRIKTSKEGEMI